MSKEKRRVPKLRFPGFTEDWEQRKLGEYANFRRGSFPQPYGNKEWYDGVGSAPFVQVVDVGDNLSLVDCTKQRISKLAQPMSVYAEKGSVLVTLQGSIGRVAVSQYDAFIDRTILIFQGYKYKTNSYFWAYIIKNKFSEEALKAPGGTIKTITKEALSNFIILYPKFSEQEQIGSFFEKLDKLITLHQRKLDNLKLKKKALLQKLFPKNGERYPELRFPGFTDAWEQRKFSDLYEKISEKNDLSYSLDKIISVANMYYKSDAKVSNEEYLRTYNIFRYGEIAFEGNKSKDFAYGRFVENTIGDGIISHVFEVFRPIVKYDIYFWKYYINYEPIMGKILSRCTKKTTMMTNLVAKDFLKETVLVPTLTEQKQIGTLLNTLDKFITLHQRKLDQLKLQKKALLQQMFV